MAKSHYGEPPSQKTKQHFAKYLSEDEELIIATGFGSTYLRQRFIIQLILPGAVFILIGFAWSYYSGAMAPGYGLILGFLVAGIFSYVMTMYIYHANRYLLTTRRIILKRGLLTVKLITALFDKITHIEMEQSLYDRMFLHHGTIKIHTAGSEKDELVLRYVESPIEFKNILERLINREREHYNRRSESVVAVEGELVEE